MTDFRLARRDEHLANGYARYRQSAHLGASEDEENAYVQGWLDGGKRVLRDSAEVAELLPTLRAMMQTADELIGRLEALIAWFEVET